MDQKIKFLKNKANRIKLNTKEFCFLCLETNQNSGIVEDDEINSSHNGLIHHHHQPVSLLCLRRHLKINGRLTNNSLELPLLETEQVEVHLCNDCEKVVKRFTVLFQELEKIQMEMDFCMDKIHVRISNGVQNTELVKNYSKNMTSDLECLPQLASIDKLRKEISKECLNIRIGRYPTVRMSKIVIEDPPNPSTAILVKQEVENDKEEDNFSIPASPYQSTSNETMATSNTESNFQDLPNPSIPVLVKKEEGNYSEGENNLDVLASPCPSPTNETTDDPNSRDSLAESKIRFKRKKNPNSKVFRRDPLTGRFPCPSCEKTFSQANVAQYHHEAIHLKKRWKCDNCNSVFSRYNLVLSHKKNCQQIMETRAAKEKRRSKFKFPCPTCGKRFPVLLALRNHQKVVHEFQKFSCDHCNKSFKSDFYLREHRKAVHLNKTWPCKYCRKEFQYQTNCTRHQKNCPQKPTIKLEESTYETHRRNFPKDCTTGKVLCPLCNKAFAKPDIAHRHYDKVHLQKKM